jgi:hypothetical protein
VSVNLYIYPECSPQPRSTPFSPKVKVTEASRLKPPVSKRLASHDFEVGYTCEEAAALQVGRPAVRFVSDISVEGQA